MPLIQKAYEKYRTDAKVRFFLISLDDDPKRLDRYVEERKFAMPVARYSREQATAVFGVHDTPTTMYIDPAGVIRYEVVGVEPHGDAVERVTWYIDQLKAR